MSPSSHVVSAKGRKKTVPAIQVGNTTIVVRGRLLKIAEIFDEYWLEKQLLPSPLCVIDEVRKCGSGIDLFTFTQRVPDTTPDFDFPYVWDNVAAIEIQSFEDWYRHGISDATRRNIRASEKRGVEVRVCSFDEIYVRGIMDIYNETPIRHGRRFWHYGKDFADVRDENGTYVERSTYLAAYYQDEMVGYCKLVRDKDTAAIMQILSKVRYLDKRPNNALMAAAVKECCAHGIRYLLYERLVYGKKTDSSLTKFKQSNGFVRMDVPRYFIPLTMKGRIAVLFGLQVGLKDRIPRWVTRLYLNLRSAWYRRAHQVDRSVRTSNRS
jgi:hypothetical protein